MPNRAHSGSFKKQDDFRVVGDELPEFYAIVERILRLAIAPEYPRTGANWLRLLLGGREGGDIKSDKKSSPEV